MTFDEALSRARRLRGRLRSGAAQAHGKKKTLRSLDAEALSILMRAACQSPVIEYLPTPDPYHDMGR